MTDHLPECIVPDFDKGLWICICNQLRACEERVKRVCKDTHATLGLKEITRIAAKGYDMGERDALSAAREGVAALDHAPRCELVWGCDCSEAHPLECTCNRDDALAAIDALKEDK